VAELVKQDTYQHNGGQLVAGVTEFTIHGEDTRYRFSAYVLNLDNGAEWIEATEQHSYASRCFDPTRIRVVHNRDLRMPDQRTAMHLAMLRNDKAERKAKR
jgi:hypothetical protein